MGAAVWLLAVMFELTHAGSPGRLCSGDAREPLTQCGNTSGALIAVMPSPRERAFVWTSADGGTLYAGTIAANAKMLLLDRSAFTPIDLTFRGDAARGWPLDVELTLGARAAAWQWTLPREVAARVRRLYVRPNRYTLTASAAHHRMLRRQLDATHPYAAGELRLLPQPLARGIVVDGDDRPIADAIVALPDGRVCVHANEQGAFACELGEPTAEALVISKPGFGAKDVTLARDTADVDLGRIALEPAHRLTLDIVRDEAKPARVTLFHDAPDRYSHAKVATQPIREREEEVTFDAAAGKYLVVVEGEGATERLETPVEVSESDVRRKIEIEPYRLAGTVTFGNAPLARGTVDIGAPQHTWRVPLTVVDGAFEATLWQHGSVTAFVLAPPATTPELVVSPELGADPSRWDIHLEKRTISGRVTDAATNAPLPNLELSVTTRGEDSSGYFAVRTREDGTYEILAHTPGTYALRIDAPDYVAVQQEIAVAAGDRSRTVDFALERGAVVPIEVVSPSGAPIAHAMVLEGVQPDRVNPQYINTTDGRGRYELHGRGGETRLLYVVPPDGSFAVARVVVPRKADASKPLQVVVPPPTSSLRVRTVDASGTPVSAPLLMRYEGEFVPGAMLRFVTKSFFGTSPAGEVIVPRLPAGAYEIWATAGPRDEEQLIATNAAGRAPVRVGLSGGDESVQVTAPPREPRAR